MLQTTQYHVPATTTAAAAAAVDVAVAASVRFSPFFSWCRSVAADLL